jgi:hypothetical protein
LENDGHVLLSKREVDLIRMPKRPNEKALRSKKKEFEKRYNARHYDIIFNRASRIKEEADKIQSKDEKLWTRLIEGQVFKVWIEKATNWGSPKYNHRAVDVVSRFRA